MASNRIGRINEEIQRELADLLRTLKDPRVQATMISVTRVETTPDLRYAKVFVSFLEKSKAAEALKGLRVRPEGTCAGSWAPRSSSVIHRSSSGGGRLHHPGRSYVGLLNSLLLQRMMKMISLTLPEAAQRLQQAHTLLLLTHRRPDGDTVGSAAALCRGLRSLGKEAAVLENPQLTDKYRPYLQGLTCPSPLPGAMTVSVDVAGREMLCKGAGDLPVDFILDHHGTNPGLCARGPDRSLGCRLRGDHIQHFAGSGRLPGPGYGRGPICGGLHRHGCFRYANTTARTLRVAAACLEAGAEAYSINRQLFETTRLPRLRLNAYLAEHLELLQAGKIALCLIPREIERETAVTEDDLEDISNFPRNVEGVDLAVTFRTLDDGATKISIRSAPCYDASHVAAALGGGGHRGAAGATLHAGQDAAREQVLQALRNLGILSQA